MKEEAVKRLLKDRYEPDFDFIPAERVRLIDDGSGWLRMTLEGDRTYLGVKVVRAFPHSQPDRYLGFLDALDDDKVIGLVADPSRLDAEMRRLAELSAADHYFIPTITRVLSMNEEFGAFYFNVETDRGQRQFVAKGVRDGIEELPDGGLLIPDVEGNRYRIRALDDLDARSQDLLEWIV